MATLAATPSGSRQFSPQTGIFIRYEKIPALMAMLFQPDQDPSYQTLPARNFDQDSFRLPFLSGEEIKRVNGFRAQKKQIEWVCGRFALKILVREKVCPEACLEEIQVSYREKGAPFLPQFPEITISLSHSNDYTAAGLCRIPGIGMGLDIEKIGPLPDPYFMKTAFTPKEIHYMTPAAQEIFRHWTLKEAFLKYLGMGFNESLHQVEVIDDTLMYLQKKKALTIWSRTIEERYILSMVADPYPG